ncbi:MAG TPA: cytochrome b [Roseiarcus sp.]|nr:cytochrome b [Roseiarcus sp.]
MKMFPPPRPVEVHHPGLRTLHWLMAFVIFVALGLGVWATQLARGDLRDEVLFVHKSFGVTALALIVLRILIRLAVGAPAYAVPLGRIVKAASGSAHLALYALMIAMPVSGYISSGAGGHDVSFFGLFTIPDIIPQSKALAEAASQAHFIFAWAIGITLGAHLTAVVWHAGVKRDTVLTRMWPRFRPGRAVR